MPLINFGSILGFAQEIEAQDQAFYQAAAANPACADHKPLFEKFAADGSKNIKILQRVKRENVTEMILQNVENFTRAPFQEDSPGGEGMTGDEALGVAKRLEDRAIRYYREAAEKLKAQSEVSLALKQLAKKRSSHQTELGG